MFAPAGVDSDSSDEDVSPITSASISPTKPKFSFKSLFVPPKLGTTPPLPPRTLDDDDGKTDPSSEPASPAPSEVDRKGRTHLQRLKRRVRILAGGDQAPTTNKGESAVAEETESTAADGGMDGDTVDEEVDPAAVQMLSLLRQLAAEQHARSDTPDVNPTAPPLTSAQPPVPPLIKADTADQTHVVAPPAQEVLPTASSKPQKPLSTKHRPPIRPQFLPSPNVVPRPSAAHPGSLGHTFSPPAHRVRRPGLNDTYFHPERYAGPPYTHTGFNSPTRAPLHGGQMQHQQLAPLSAPAWQAWQNPHSPNLQPYHPYYTTPPTDRMQNHPPPMYPHPYALQPWHPGSHPLDRSPYQYHQCHLPNQYFHPLQSAPPLAQSDYHYDPYSHQSPTGPQPPWSSGGPGYPAPWSPGLPLLNPWDRPAWGTVGGPQVAGSIVAGGSSESVVCRGPARRSDEAGTTLQSRARSSHTAPTTAEWRRTPTPEMDNNTLQDGLEIAGRDPAKPTNRESLSRSRQAESATCLGSTPSRTGQEDSGGRQPAMLDPAPGPESSSAVDTTRQSFDRPARQPPRPEVAQPEPFAGMLTQAPCTPAAQQPHVANKGAESGSSQHSAQPDLVAALVSAAVCIDLAYSSFQRLKMRHNVQDAEQGQFAGRLWLDMGNILAGGKDIPGAFEALLGDRRSGETLVKELHTIAGFISHSPLFPSNPPASDEDAKATRDGIVQLLSSNDTLLDLMRQWPISRYLIPGVISVVKDVATKWRAGKLSLKAVLRAVLTIRKELERPEQSASSRETGLLDQLAVILSKQLRHQSVQDSPSARQQETTKPIESPARRSADPSTTPKAPPPRPKPIVKPPTVVDDSSDSAYSASPPESPGTLESDDEADMMLAVADSGPQIQPKREHVEGRHRPGREQVKAAREVLMR